MSRKQTKRKSSDEDINVIYGKKPVSVQQSNLFNEKRTTRSQRRKELEEERIRKQNSPPVERVEEDFGHTVFPNEIWDKVFLFLSNRDLRTLTLTCKNLRSLSNRILWDTPSFKKCVNPEDFETLIHLPIRKLHTYDLYFKRKKAALWFTEMFEEMPQLMELEVCNNGKASNDLSMDALKIISPYVTKITTGGISCEDRTEFAEELAAIDFPKLQSMVITDMVGRRYDRYRLHNYRYKLEDLQILNHLPITKINMRSLQPDYEVDESGSCIFRSGHSVPFPQVAFLLEMKSLRKVTVNLWCSYFSGALPPEVSFLKELQSKNGVVLDVSGCPAKIKNELSY